MDRTQVMQQLQQVFDNVFIEKVILTDELSAKDVAEWDSLTHITLLVAIEKSFSIRFRLGEVDDVRNVGEFVTLILKTMERGKLDHADAA